MSDSDSESERKIEPTSSNTQGEENEDCTFEDLGLNEVICEKAKSMSWTKPTKIQRQAIPPAIEGKDIIALAETGSGKTAAFALPILQALLAKRQTFFALILTPTRELADQIRQQFEALGTSIGVQCAVIIGGANLTQQALMLAKKPHIIIATPGRLIEHMENTKGFSLKSFKFLVLDEADRILNQNFEVELDKILKCKPKECTTFLFSATMTNQVRKLQRAALKNPVKVEVSNKYQTVEKLKQYYVFPQVQKKDEYLISILEKLSGQSFIIFCSTCKSTILMSLLLRQLGYLAVPLHGQMSQEKRFSSLEKFKAQSRSTLVCTDVASRGLDIPHIDVVINYDIPTHSKDYIHRVGRTARAGKAGISITFVNVYEIQQFQRIEQLIGKKMDKFEIEESKLDSLTNRVVDARAKVKMEMKKIENNKAQKNKRRNNEDDDEDDTEQSSGYQKRLKKSGNKKRRN
ncbi:hypothetical protein TKK_0002242 [Trichogramma kaykai]